MPDTIDLLKWSSLTKTVNEIKSPNQFVKKLLFSSHEPKETETIEIGVLDGDREIAPFVTKNGEAIMVSGIGERFQTVEAPNIRIKRPLPPNDALSNRRPGSIIFPGQGGIVSAAEQYVARQLGRLADLVTNAEEYLCCMALQGTISYQVSDDANFTITYPKPSGNSVDLGTNNYWADSTSNPEVDCYEAKRVVSEEVGLGITDCILGSEAAVSFLKSSTVRSLLDVRNVTAGGQDFTTQFSEDGAIFLGTFCGIRFWAYPRQVKVNGTMTDLIRSKYAEFVCRVPAAEFTLYYGAIHDWKALQNRSFVGERFSKSWEDEDPSVRQLLTHSRPLPVPRRMGAVYSAKVVTG